MPWIYYSRQVQFLNTMPRLMIVSLSTWRTKKGLGALKNSYFISTAGGGWYQKLVQNWVEEEILF